MPVGANGDEEISTLAKDGKPGWDAQATRLIEQRRVLQESFAGDESALYGVYGKIKESTRTIGEDPPFPAATWYARTPRPSGPTPWPGC